MPEAWDATAGNVDHSIDTRLIGKEDVNWDVDGGGEVDSFVDRYGVTHGVTRIHAGHVPLPGAARVKCDGATNVATGIIALAEKVEDITAGQTPLAEDTLLEIAAGLNQDEKQALIDGQTKNLGGHTLTFQFPEALDTILTAPLDFSGFYNGKLVIDLNTTSISDAADLGKLLYLHDNTCHTAVKNGTLRHSLSQYAVRAERCPALYLDDLAFYGTGGLDSCAVSATDCDGKITDCTYHDDAALELDGIIADQLTAHNADEDAHAELMEKKADLVSPTFSGTPKAPTAAAGTNTTQLATTAFVKTATDAHADSNSAHAALLTKYVPAGTVLPFAGTSTPAGFLLCNGATVSRTQYAALFTAIGTSYGAGDGSTTFKIPDFRGKFLRGYLANTTEAIGTAQGASLPNIKGTVKVMRLGWKDGGTFTGAFSDTGAGDAQGVHYGDTGYPSIKIDFKASNSSGVYKDGATVVPQNYAVLYIIKY